MDAEVRFRHAIVLVRDVPTSRTFYESALGQRVQEDAGTIVWFEGGLVVHDGADLQRKAFKRDFEPAAQGHANLDLYFETDDLAACQDRVVAAGAELVHPIERQEWGQHVFRFLDPDGHLVEVGEPMPPTS